MFYISTSIDLHQGIMSTSLRCREKLLIDINADFHSGGREEIELQAQRLDKNYNFVIFHMACGFCSSVSALLNIAPGQNDLTFL